MEHQDNNRKNKHKIILFFCALFIILFVAIVATEVTYAYKMYPRSVVGNFNIAGKTKGEAIEFLTTKTDEALSKGLNFTFQGEKANIEPLITSSTGDGVFGEIYSYNIKETVNQAYDHGHVGSWTKKVKEKISAITSQHKTNFVLNLDEKKLEEVLRDNFQKLKKEAQDAKLDISIQNKETLIAIKKESDGYAFDYNQAIQEAKKQLLSLQNNDIELKITKDKPKITKQDLQQIIPKIKTTVDFAPITLVYNEDKWEISKDRLASWLEVGRDGDILKIQIIKEKAEKFLNEEVATKINIPTTDARFEITNGKVSQFQSSKDGLELNIEKTIQEVEQKLFEEMKKEISLVVEITKSTVENTAVNDLGIVEMIGKGESNFSGSPKNRIHNITTGAKALNGLLIKPGETFSLIKALGDIDAKNGYLQELVIKGNKTTPEFGGGLCQIGTTTFRAAMQSGLPIVERRNHSYNVSYYGPTGTDATIYNPSPDMKFLNDTGNHILFLTKMVGDGLVFELWGTKDGRSVKFIGKEEVTEVTKLVPKTYNIRKPGEPKYIETDKLEPGKKRRLEYGHTGADATFDYIVNYQNGETKQKTFSSHYVPWREVWQIGVEKVETTETKTENEITPKPTEPTTLKPAEITTNN